MLGCEGEVVDIRKCEILRQRQAPDELTWG
jgi:hypothetical protein